MPDLSIQPLRLPGCLLIERAAHVDARGSFMKPFQRSAFREAGLPDVFVEQFFSRSRAGVVRGLHLQVPPHAQWKLVSCLSGTVHDVLLDVRAGASYGQNDVVHLSGDDGRAVLIPPGVAHGFQSLVDDTVVAYWVSAEYNAVADTGIRWDSAGIDWPTGQSLTVSARDAALPALADFESPFGPWPT